MSELSVLMVISAGSAALAAVVARRYSYDTLTLVEACAGIVLLLVITLFLWFQRRRLSRGGNNPGVQRAVQVGMALGLLWTIEISLNNFAAPPLPARDIIDNLFWAAVALSILALAFVRAHRTGNLVQGMQAAGWAGLASGLVACGTALAVIVFGMRFLLRDPLNLAEWAGRGSAAPGMAAYFAFETFAGALGHLVVLGIGMGLVLGLLGGAAGKVLQGVRRRMRNPRAVQ